MGSARTSPLLLGHRGARAIKTIPENTIASFDRALADGCDGFEFDVRLTADGKAVIWHDADFEGIEIAKARAEKLTGLSLLEDVLVRYRDCAFLDIELKVAGLEKITADALCRCPLKRGFVVSSFLPEVLRTLHAVDPGIPLGVICEKNAELVGWKELPVAYVIPHQKLARPTLTHELKAAGKKVLVWTVNGAAEMRRFAGSGIDGIISDDTSLLCETLGE